MHDDFVGNENENIYNNIGQLDRLLSNGHTILCHLGHLGITIGLGTLRPRRSPIDTPIFNGLQ
jgi:hypothetical protein